jgi:hypothetical protein
LLQADLLLVKGVSKYGGRPGDLGKLFKEIFVEVVTPLAVQASHDADRLLQWLGVAQSYACETKCSRAGIPVLLPVLWCACPGVPSATTL